MTTLLRFNKNTTIKTPSIPLTGRQSFLDFINKYSYQNAILLGFQNLYNHKNAIHSHTRKANLLGIFRNKLIYQNAINYPFRLANLNEFLK